MLSFSVTLFLSLFEWRSVKHGVSEVQVPPKWPRRLLGPSRLNKYQCTLVCSSATGPPRCLLHLQPAFGCLREEGAAKWRWSLNPLSTKLCLWRSPSARQFHAITWTHRLCARGKKLQLCTESYLELQQPPLRTQSHGFVERRRTSEHEVECICMRRRWAISVTSSYVKTEFRLATLHIHTCM